MKTPTFSLVLLLFVFSCSKEESCPHQTEVSTPEGFQIRKISSLAFDGDVLGMQFVTPFTGFILGNKSDMGFALLKTNDGGNTWALKILSLQKAAIDWLFLDENTGFITSQNDSPNPNLTKTTDGGEDWKSLTFPELEGNIFDLHHDESQNLYGRLFNLEDSTKIIKSYDKGESWEVIHTVAKFTGKILAVHKNTIYLESSDDQLKLIDLEGNHLKTIQMEHKNNVIVDFQVIDEDNLVVTSFYSVIKTTDGGNSWTQIYDAEARLIDFASPDNGVMVLNKGYCGDSPIENSVIASTSDGGQQWVEGAHIDDFVHQYVTAQKMADNDYIILVDNWREDVMEFYRMDQ